MAETKSGIGFFEKYLTIWVAACMVVGVIIGVYFPSIPELLSEFECIYPRSNTYMVDDIANNIRGWFQTI